MPHDSVLTGFGGCRGRIGLLGGSFDPVHFGHIEAARALRSRLKLSCCVFIPAHQNPLKADRPRASDADRFEMLRLALPEEAGLFVSPIELVRGASAADAASYTVDTVERIRSEAPADAELCLLIGSDLLGQLYRWKRVDRLFSLCTLVPFVREGYSTEIDAAALNLSPELAAKLQAGLVEIPRRRLSSEELRRALHAGEPVQPFAPAPVMAYIKAKGLYR